MVAEVAKQMRHLFTKPMRKKKKHKLQRRSLSLVAALVIVLTQGKIKSPHCFMQVLASPSGPTTH